MLVTIAPAVTGDLTVLATVKAELGIEGSGEDGYLAGLISQASAMLAAFCGRITFGTERLRQIERLDRSRDAILLKRNLQPRIINVTEDSVSLDPAAYEISGALLYRLEAERRVPWPTDRRIEVIYDSGYDLLSGLPHDLERACLEVIKAQYHARGRDPLLRSESVEGIGSSAWLDPRAGMEALPPQAAALAAPYRAWAV